MMFLQAIPSGLCRGAKRLFVAVTPTCPEWPIARATLTRRRQRR
jgi:hypothetical protein